MNEKLEDNSFIVMKINRLILDLVRLKNKL